MYGSVDPAVSKTLAHSESVLIKGHYLGGAHLTHLDKQFYDDLKAHAHQISPLTHPFSFAHFVLVSKFKEDAQSRWPLAKEASAPKKAAAPKKEEDDLDDLFGDDDDDAEAAKAAAAAAKEAAKKKKKKEAVAMSLVMLEVKPMDDTINLDELAAKIFAEVTQDGLFWKTEYKKEPVAFGIFKLILGFSLEDEKVSVDGVVEKIEEMEDFVQSVEIAAFNKI